MNKYWLCCGSKDVAHKDEIADRCLESADVNADRFRYGTAEDHMIWQFEKLGYKPEEYRNFMRPDTEVYIPNAFEFEECPQCAAKAGTPPLCVSCCHNRRAIENLKKKIQNPVVKTLEFTIPEVHASKSAEVITVIDKVMVMYRHELKSSDNIAIANYFMNKHGCGS